MGNEKVRGNNLSGECFLIAFFFPILGLGDSLTNPDSTQVLAIPARTEQYALFFYTYHLQ